MTLLRSLTLYLVAVHLVIAAILATLLWHDHRPWILLVEAGVALSALGGWLLLRTLRTPEELARIGTEWIREADFAHSFRPSGTADLQGLIELYNRMLQRLREERIRQQEQELLLEKVLSASPSGVLTTDHDGRFTLANRAAEELLGIKSSHVIGSAPDQADSPLVRQLARVPQGESRLLGPRNSRRLRVTRSRFFDRGFARELFLVEDLTHELWATEKEAYNALIRTLSHEINNTLGAAGSILESALHYADQLRPEDRTDFTNALKVAIERTGNLSSFMQRYAEVARTPPPSPTPADLAPILERIACLVAPECRERGIEVAVKVADGLPQVALDVAQIEQVLVNIVRNAMEAIRADGTIEIAAEAVTGGLRLRIVDSGPGLSLEARDGLFTPFFSDKTDGQGVGLTLAREILTQHGFQFALESPDSGPTTFAITMPAQPR